MKGAHPKEFNPRLRSQIIRAVSGVGSFIGSRAGVHFAIYRGMAGVILLIAEGRRWRQFPAETVWSSLDLIEKRILGRETPRSANASFNASSR